MTLGERLVAARRSGVPIPAEMLQSEADAYAVQEAVIRALPARIGGWKVGASSPEAEPSTAPLFADLIAESPPRGTLGGVEAELAFRVERALPARARPYDEAEAWAAMGSMHPAIEILDSRFRDFAAASKLAQLADNISNGGFCYGPPIAAWREVDFLNQEALLLIDGQVVARAAGGNAAGHPRRLLAWLANHCAARGHPLTPGQMITTGSHTGLHFAPPGAKVTARFPGRGEVSLAFNR